MDGPVRKAPAAKNGASPQKKTARAKASTPEKAKARPPAETEAEEAPKKASAKAESDDDANAAESDDDADAAESDEETGGAPSKSEPAETGPAFARAFPRDPKLQRLVALFEQGNYAAVHADGRALIARLSSRDGAAGGPKPRAPEERLKDEAVRAAVNELIARTRPDPLALYLLAIAAALLAVLAGWYWTHPHEDAPPAQPAARPPAASPGPT